MHRGATGLHDQHEPMSSWVMEAAPVPPVSSCAKNNLKTSLNSETISFFRFIFMIFSVFLSLSLLPVSANRHETWFAVSFWMQWLLLACLCRTQSRLCKYQQVSSTCIHVGCVSHEFDGFKPKTTTSFHLPLNIYEQSVVEDDWSVGIELQTCKWLEANGLSIDLRASRNEISFQEVEECLEDPVISVWTSVGSAFSLGPTLEFIKDPSVVFSVVFDEPDMKLFICMLVINTSLYITLFKLSGTVCFIISRFFSLRYRRHSLRIEEEKRKIETLADLRLGGYMLISLWLWEEKQHKSTETMDFVMKQALGGKYSTLSPRPFAPKPPIMWQEESFSVEDGSTVELKQQKLGVMLLENINQQMQGIVWNYFYAELHFFHWNMEINSH